MGTKFFSPVSPFGALTGWECQSANPTSGNTRAQALANSGDEMASQLHDMKMSVTATYTLKTLANAKVPKFGEILNGYHVDSASITHTNTGFVSMTVNGHKHGTTAHPACRTYTGSLTLTMLFGCPAAPLGFEIPSGSGVRTHTWTIDGNHVDELGSDGNFLAADNYDGKEVCTVELCSSGTIDAADGWDATSVGNTEDNTAAMTASATVEKHLTGVAPTT